MRPRIRVTPPGEKAKSVIRRDSKALATTTKTSPIVAVKGKGVYIEDIDGNVYIDFTSGVGVRSTGYCHPEVVKAIKSQAEKLIHFAGTDFYYQVQVELAEKLASITPGRFSKKVFYTNSGTESVEAAIKIVRWSTRRKRMIGFIGAFHGRTIGSLSITASKPVHRDRFFPMMPGVDHIPYANCYRCPYRMSYPECDVWCAKILEELYFETYIPPEEVGGIFIEPVQGEGGYIVPPSRFVKEMRAIAKRHGILLVDDEVQAGFGRTGRMFATEHHGVVPDVITLAKGIGSGVPIGAVVFNRKYDFGVQGAHSNTYGGNLVGCASALATIRVIEKERLVKNAEAMGKVMHERLSEMTERFKNLDNARGLGLMRAVEVVKSKKTKAYHPKLRDRVIKRAYEKGLILLPCGKSAVRFIPPLVINEEEVKTGMDLFEKAVKEVM